MQHAHKNSKNISGGSALESAVRIGEGREVAEAQSIAPFVLWNYSQAQLVNLHYSVLQQQLLLKE